MGYIGNAKLRLFCLLITYVFLATACDHTDLTGTINILSNDYMVDEIMPLVLTVPDELSAIHKLHWSIESSVLDDNSPNMIYDSEIMLEVFSTVELEGFFGKDYDIERIAVFIPVYPGDYIIRVDGFYRQTNPQPISEIKVTIEPSKEAGAFAIISH